MTSNLDVLANGVNKYIVRPINAFGLGGFVFDIEGNTNINLSTEITDHFLEDNSTIQDHIAIKPKKVTLDTYVGELVFRDDDGESESITQEAVRKLTIANDLLPTLSQGARQINDFIRGDGLSGLSLGDVNLNTVNNFTDYWAFAKNLSPPVTRQEQAYLYFKALMEGKFLLSLQTPFEFMNSMAIESIIAEQTEKSRSISNFSITLKEVRTVTLLNVQASSDGERFVENEFTDEQQYQGRNFFQQQTQTTIGNVKGLDVEGDPLLQHRIARDLQAEKLRRLTVEDIEDLI